MFVSAGILLTVVVSVILLVRNYFRNYCLECREPTDWNTYGLCLRCKAAQDEKAAKGREDRIARMVEAANEALERSIADTQEFGFSDYDLLDKPCEVCAPGPPKSHREILRANGLAGDPIACLRYILGTHIPLSRKAHIARESKKFWKRWLYIPPTKQEEAEVGRICWWLQNTLSAGCDDLARLREYRNYREQPDHWMDMTTRQLLKRRLVRAGTSLGFRNDR